MFCTIFIAFSALLWMGSCTNIGALPPGFMFGAATASYQVEGAWNISDKGISIWDNLAHKKPPVITDGATGDFACDSYHLWRRDIEMLTELGVDFYRFSISWTRLLPTGFSNYISEDGKRYYNDLINALIEKGIKPVITIYHWDLPQTFQNLGGWANPLIADWLSEYARVIFNLFADRVKIWVTINESMLICDGGYSNGDMAPRVMSKDSIGVYICNKNLLLAHAKVYRLYDTEFRPQHHGIISIVNHLPWFEPVSDNDVYATDLVLQHVNGRYTHPIHSKEGGWPPEIERLIAINSKRQGYQRSRLPAFTREEIEYIRGTYDYLGVNHYTSRAVLTGDPNQKPINRYGIDEYNYTIISPPNWPVANVAWLVCYPEGLRYILRWIVKEYGNIKILITENGFSTTSINYIEDDDRVKYYNDYIKQMQLAVTEDGINVIGYTAWSLMDNFEWMDGYKYKFGLYEVNFTDPHRTRTPRKSAKFYANLIRSQKNIEAGGTSNSSIYALSFVILIIIALAGFGGYHLYNRSAAKRRKYVRKEFEDDYEMLITEKQIIKE